MHDVTYENSQARERTQILMDVANQTWGMVIGTGDLSELALGWATYNGDHMSMYGVNASVPKTLVKYLVQWVAENGVDEDSKTTLLDIVGYSYQSGTDSGRRKRRNQTKDGRPSRSLRTTRLLPLLFPTFRFPPFKDLLSGKHRIQR